MTDHKRPINYQNKAVLPASDKTLRVRVLPGRAVQGIGEPGAEALVNEQEAKRLASIGYVEIISNEEA